MTRASPSLSRRVLATGGGVGLAVAAGLTLGARAIPAPAWDASGPRLKIEVVTPEAPEPEPGSRMDVGELVDGYVHRVAAPPPQTVDAFLTYDDWRQDDREADRLTGEVDERAEPARRWWRSGWERLREARPAPPEPEARRGRFGFGFDDPRPAWAQERRRRREQLDRIEAAARQRMAGMGAERRPWPRPVREEAGVRPPPPEAQGPRDLDPEEVFF